MDQRAETMLGAYLRKQGIGPIQFAREKGFPPAQVSMWARAIRRPGRANALELEKVTGIPATYWNEVDLVPAKTRLKRRRTKKVA